MSEAPSRAPSNAPSQAPSRAPSQSPAWLALTSDSPQSPNYKAPTALTIPEGSSSASPATIVPASRGLHPKTYASHLLQSRAPGSFSSRVGGTHAPSQAAVATTSRYPGSMAGDGVPTLSEAPSAAPSAAPKHRDTQSMAPDADDMPTPTTVAPVGKTTFPKSAMTNRGQNIDPDEAGGGAPTMIPTASGVPIATKYTSQADIAAATRQANYSTLGEEERRKQDKWAKGKADQFAPCPMSYMWERHATHPGYRCMGGTHFMSDLALTEGAPSLYSRNRPPRSIRDQYTPKWHEGQVPYGFWGPFKPMGWDKEEEEWVYPPWC